MAADQRARVEPQHVDRLRNIINVFDMNIKVVQHHIATLEAKISMKRAANTKEQQVPIATATQSLRERRQQQPLNCDPSADKSTTGLASANFFSPSCHDWSAEQLLTSAIWTPFGSPRRSLHSGKNWRA